MAGGALSHLDAALIALCDGDHAEDLIAIERALAGSTSLSSIAAAIRTATAEIREARKLLVGSNVKPAPFFLNEKTVKEVLERPIEVQGKLADRPRRSENPRLAKANDDSPVEPVTEPNPGPEPEVFPSPDQAEAPTPDDFATPDHLSQADRDAERAFEQASLGKELNRRASILPAARNKPRKSDARVQAKDAEARELERPVDAVLAGGAPARFRAKSAQRASEKRAAGITPRREAKALPPLPFEQRKARLQAAEAFLKSQGILVTVRDREAQIRTYRVTGEKSALLAEQVIEIAIARGMSA